MSCWGAFVFQANSSVSVREWKRNLPCRCCSSSFLSPGTALYSRQTFGNEWGRAGRRPLTRAPSHLWLVSAPRSGCDFVPSPCLPVLYAVFAIKASLWMCRCGGVSLLRRRGRGVSAHWGKVGTWHVLLFPCHFKLVSIKRVSSQEEPRLHRLPPPCLLLSGGAVTASLPPILPLLS